MAVPVDERLVSEQAARLGAGGLRFTPRQLYYAVCAQLERGDGSRARLQIGVGLVIAVVGLVLTAILAVGIIFLTLFGLAVVSFGVQDQRRRRSLPRTRPLAFSYREFVETVLAPRRRAGGGLDGLIDDSALERGAPVPVAEGDDVCALVVCDRRETAALLRVNQSVAGLRIRVADAGSIGDQLDEPVIFALHDADPAGCRLPVALRAAGATEVIDIGLRPSQVAKRHVQVIQGAPAFVPPEMAGLLTSDEIVWLADGFRVELAIAGPAEIIGAVRRATADEAVPVGAAGMPPGISVSVESPLGPPLAVRSPASRRAPS